jgi:hypothetical protein
LAIDASVHQKAMSGCVQCNLFILLNASQLCAALLHIEEKNGRMFNFVEHAS